MSLACFNLQTAKSLQKGIHKNRSSWAHERIVEFMVRSFFLPSDPIQMNSWFPLLLEIPSFNQSCFPTADHPKPSSSLSVTCETDCKASIESFVYITLIIEKLLGTGSRALASTVECVTGRLQVATRGATGCLYGTSHGPCLRGCVLETFNGLDSFGRCEAAEGG